MTNTINPQLQMTSSRQEIRKLAGKKMSSIGQKKLKINSGKTLIAWPNDFFSNRAGAAKRILANRKTTICGLNSC